jgi:hypothetical protein
MRRQVKGSMGGIIMGTRKNSLYKSIARRCLECLGGSPVKCNMPGCPIYGIRPGTKRSEGGEFTGGGKKLLPKFKLSNLLKSIRAECMVCSGNNPQDCTSINCYFYPWRSGTSVRHRPHLSTASTTAQDGPNFDDCQELGDKAA